MNRHSGEQFANQANDLASQSEFAARFLNDLKGEQFTIYLQNNQKTDLKQYGFPDVEITADGSVRCPDLSFNTQTGDIHTPNRPTGRRNDRQDQAGTNRDPHTDAIDTVPNYRTPQNPTGKQPNRPLRQDQNEQAPNHSGSGIYNQKSKSIPVPPPQPVRNEPANTACRPIVLPINEPTVDGPLDYSSPERQVRTRFIRVPNPDC